MRAEAQRGSRAEVVGVVLHEGHAAREALAHDLDDAHQRGRLPVALAGEAVAVGHEALGADARQLLERAEVLEGVREGAEAALHQEGAQAQLDARGIAQRLAPLAARAQLRDDLVGLVVLGAEAVDLRIGDLAATVSASSLTGYVLHGGAQARLDLHLVALGDGDLAHVVAEAADLQGARLVGAGSRARPGADARLDRRVLPVAGDDLAGMAQPRHDVGELAVAVRRLVEVHEGHVDVGVGQVAPVLRVQVQERLLQRLQAGDPHLGRARRCASRR